MKAHLRISDALFYFLSLSSLPEICHFLPEIYKIIPPIYFFMPFFSKMGIVVFLMENKI